LSTGKLGQQTRGPLYKAVKQRLLDQLASGALKPAQPLPAENQLAAQFGVSIGTLRKAIDALVAENILIRQQGRGTFVAEHDRERLLFQFFHIERQDGHKTYPEVRLDQFSKGRANAEAAQALQVPLAEPVYLITNVLWLNQEPVLVDEITLCQARFPGLTEAIFKARDNTIYNLYQARYQVTVLRTEERLRAELANAAQAGLLAIPESTQVLTIRRVAFSYESEAVEWRVSTVNTARYEYRNEL
jgi:GntR family transcriptional regulator